MEALPSYQKDIRPWGQFERFTLNEKSTVKLITVLPDQELSLQSHEHRDEFWRIVSGSGLATVGDSEKPVATGDEVFVLRGSKHRVSGGPQGLQFLEIALGDFDEGDITRFEDRYGRA